MTEEVHIKKTSSVGPSATVAFAAGLLPGSMKSELLLNKVVDKQTENFPFITAITTLQEENKVTAEDLGKLQKALEDTFGLQPTAAEFAEHARVIGRTGVTASDAVAGLRGLTLPKHLVNAQRELDSGLYKFGPYKIQIHRGWERKQVTWRSKASRKKRRAYRVVKKSWDYPMKPGEYLLMEQAKTVVCRAEDVDALLKKMESHSDLFSAINDLTSPNRKP